MSYRFGDFEIDPQTRLLTRSGQPLELPRRVFDCLLCLIERQPGAVSRDALIQQVWGRANVSDNQLAQTILRLRRALGDSGEAPRHIGTVPGYGYRWLAPLQPAADPPADTTTAAPSPAAVGQTLDSARTARRPRPAWRGLAVAAAAAIVAIGLAAWTLLPRFAEPGLPPSEGSDHSFAVMPARVEQAERAGWARHGLMAVVTARLSEAGLAPVALEQVLARLPPGSEADQLDAAQLRRRFDGRAPLRILAAPAAEADTWRVQLSLLREPPLQVEAQHVDLIEASRLATDALLHALGHPGVAGAPGEALAMARRALQRHDFEGVRQLLSRLSSGEDEDVEIALLRIELDLASGQLRSAGARIEALTGSIALEDAGFGAERLQLLRLQWQRLSGAALDGAAINAMVMQLEQRQAPAALLARALQARGSQALGSGRSAEAAPDFARAHRLFLDAGDAARAASASSNLAMLALLDGRHVEALAMLQAAADVFRAEGDIGRLFNALSSIDALQMGQLRWQEALAANDGAGALLPLIEDASARLSYYRRRALIVLGLGRLDEAETLLAQARAEADRGEANPESRARFGLYEAQLALARGDGAAAYASALPVFEHVYARYGAAAEPQVRTDARDLALQLMIQGLRLEARRQPQAPMPVLPASAEATLAAAFSPLALLARGRWRELQGDLDGAEADLRAALAGAQAFNRLTRLYSVTEGLVELLVAQGRGSEAETLFLGLLSRDPQLPERDYDSAALELRLQLALGDDDAIRRARERAQSLAGQRRLPADLDGFVLRVSALAGQAAPR